ncbi:hypothetical protein Agub_g15486 [Astrephomene gubernaculifera]|uniref:Kinesin motor domain-containing protein n=1 Tax=Astrephomene gubernaculifera TaxID=47775 RepID=A0AAD3E3B4_9CHLO|nr:hypothetical protein Agub_g15486 [Astrephomene gubernaculifera]
MFSPPISALPPGVPPLPSSRGSSLTPLDGLRPFPVPDGPFNASGMMPPPSNRGVRAASANTRPSPLAASGRGAAAAMSPLQANNLSEADNIKVAVRVRPLFPHETERGGTSVVQVSSNTTIKVVVPGPAGTSMQRDFAFHACLGPEVGQADVLHLCGVPQLLDAALAGYNVTIVAYGQTGSGKTYTMSGREEVISSDGYSGGDTQHDGIMTRALQHLFAAMQARKGDTKYGVAASYLEIYNEGIYDLLNLKAKNLPVKWDAALGFYVPGLKQVPCTKIDTMMDVIRTGMQHRHVGSHELNIESSRSHAIMTLTLHATPADPAAADYGAPRMGKISFVDLAGSERLKDTKSEGAMLKETTNINKSLFVLGKVISALAERDSAGTSAHIPYRDSKLTKLLMDCLGGNALALMIACCSPASTAVEETLSTLSYATRAKNIQNRPTVQYDPREAQIANLRREIELLRQENTYLREQVRLGGTAGAASASGFLSDCVSTPLLHGARPAWPPLVPSQPPPQQQLQPGGGTWDGSLAPGGLNSTLGGSSTASSSSHQQQHPHAPWPSLMNPPDSATGSSRDSGREAGGAAAAAVAAAAPLPPRLMSSGRMVTSASPEGYHSRGGTASGGTHLEPLRMSGGEAAAAGVNGAGGGGGGGMTSRRLSLAGPPDDDLMRRLMETQALLSRFSEENGRLAKENDRLRAGRQLLSQEHGEVLDEIELLRSKLVALESAVLSGAQTPNAAKAALLSAVAGGLSRSDSPVCSGSSSPMQPAAAQQQQQVQQMGGGGGGAAGVVGSSGLGGSSGAGGTGLGLGLGSSASPLRGRPDSMNSQGHGASSSPSSSMSLGGPGGQTQVLAGQQQQLQQHPQQHPQQQPQHQQGPNKQQYYQQQHAQQHDQPSSRSAADAYLPPPGSASQQRQEQQQQHCPPQQQQHHQQPQPPPQQQQPQSSHGSNHHPPTSTSTSTTPPHPHPHPHQPAQPHPQQQYPAPANVMSVGTAPGNSGAMRSRTKYGSSGSGSGGGGPGGGGRGDDSIIVADRSKLALLLGDGPVEPAVPVRPLPIKPPEPSYANPAKAHHAQHIQKQLQRSTSNPTSPTGAIPGPGGGVS